MKTKIIKIALHLSFIIINTIYLIPLLISFQKWVTVFYLARVGIIDVVIFINKKKQKKKSISPYL
jgi:hypothetical protein